MAEPFIAEIRMFPYNFAPEGWAHCDGRLMNPSQNPTLFSLLGNMYGGDGKTTFALPDLRGRVPVHVDNGLPQGLRHGVENVVLTENEMPTHSHSVMASTDDASQGPTGGVLAHIGFLDAYHDAPTDPGDRAVMSAYGVGDIGQGQAHYNMQPSLVVPFCIALEGIYPQRQ
jgi:microcystin-dependent protein